MAPLPAPMVLAVTVGIVLVSSFVSMAQMNKTDKLVAVWQERVAAQRKAAAAVEVIEQQIERVQRETASLVKRSKHALRAHADKLIEEVQAAAKTTPAPPQLASDPVKQSADRARFLARRAMQTRCPREKQLHHHELIDALYTKAILDDQTQWEDGRDALQSLSAELMQLERRGRDGMATLRHLEAKMAEIAELWPRWFDEAHGEQPIYRGLYSKDATMHEAHEDGLRAYQQWKKEHGHS